jgi:hypothetical protein
MRRQDPYADIATPVPAGDPYADIALPISTNRNRRQAPPPTGPAGQNGEDVPFQPELLPNDNGIYPDTGPGSSPNNPIDLATVDRATAAGMTRGMWVKGPDGTVYPLPADPVEGQFRVGDLPQAPGVNVRPQSVVEDIAKSLPTGVVEGLTGLAGMQGTIGQMIYGEQSLGQNMPGFGIVGPTGEQLNETIRQGLGRDYYQPQTVAGEYSRTFGEFLPGALAPGSALARGASVAVPAFTSETAGQIARGMSGGERDTTAEGLARLGGGLLGGFGVGGLSAVRGGADISLRNAAEGVTPQNLQLATALRRDAEAMGIDLTNAEAIQQVTGGGSGLGRLQRVVEGQTTRMAPMFANRPAQVQTAIQARLNQIAPNVEPGELAGQAQSAAENVLTRMRQRVNESAEPLYAQLPGQTLDPADLARLQANASYRNASAQLMGNEELAPLVTGGPEDLSTVNRVIQQLDTMGEQARPGVMNPTGNYTLAAQREQAAALARQLAGATSPEFAAARQTVATGRQAFVDPLRRGPIGTIAGQSDVQPNLAGQTEALFPSMPFEGQAAETARALELMGEIDPSVGGPLVRQQLARQAMEAQQNLATGANQFGGANFAARAFGNPEQRRTVMGALDVVNRPDPNMAFPPLSANAAPARGSDPMAQLVEVLQATGQRHRAGSDTAFNQDIQRQMAGGNVASGAVRSVANIPGIPGRIATGIDDIVARRNAETLADLLMANSEDFNARLTRALNRPRGANRVRAGVAVTAGQED